MTLSKSSTQSWIMFTKFSWSEAYLCMVILMLFNLNEWRFSDHSWKHKVWPNPPKSCEMSQILRMYPLLTCLNWCKLAVVQRLHWFTGVISKKIIKKTLKNKLWFHGPKNSTTSKIAKKGPHCIYYLKEIICSEFF